MQMKKICPSILAADFSKLYSEIKEVEEAGADIIHCDIMDGQFVPNITFGPEMVARVNEITELPLDVHLMINDADNFIEKFIDAGADYISVHIENNIHLNRVVEKIKSYKIKAGVVLNPATPVFLLNDIIKYTDFVLLMSVNPGFGGQKFIPNSFDKINELKKLIAKNNPGCEIEIDGGIGLDNIKIISDAGVDMFVCGASVFKAKDKKKVLSDMKRLLAVNI
jgi:ribulose-phosphate 3-epimerase